MTVEAIAAGIAQLRTAWLADLAAHLQVLTEVCRTDCVGILNTLSDYQSAHAEIIAETPELAGLPDRERRLFQFDEMPHASRVAACVRRRGAYDNFDARLYVLSPYISTVAAAATTLCQRLHADLKQRGSAATTPAAKAAAVIVKDRITRFRAEAVPRLTDCMIDWLAAIFTGPDGGDVFSLCESAYGPKSPEVRGKERYREFVIRQIDEWLTDHMRLPPVLAAEARAIWIQATSSLALHADSYAQALPAPPE